MGGGAAGYVYEGLYKPLGVKVAVKVILFFKNGIKIIIFFLKFLINKK